MVLVGVSSRAPGSVGLVVVGPSAVVRALGATVGVSISPGPGGGRRCPHRTLMVLALANTGGGMGGKGLLGWREAGAPIVALPRSLLPFPLLLL